MPDTIEIRAALARLIASPGFSKSPQLAHFLRFIVDETLDGRGDRIKVYTIATDALGRDADFDPQSDPIVRVEAGRLRHTLAHYYANGGSNDPVVIELPCGRYVPVFRPNSTRRRAVTRFDALRRQIAGAISQNYRLVLLIAVIATAVSLTVEAIEHTVWLEAENSPAATSSAPPPMACSTNWPWPCLPHDGAAATTPAIANQASSTAADGRSQIRQQTP